MKIVIGKIKHQEIGLVNYTNNILFTCTFFVSKVFTIITVSPLSIHKIFKMLSIVSVIDYAFLTILGRCRSCHHFNFFSHDCCLRVVCHKNLYLKSLATKNILM